MLETLHFPTAEAEASSGSLRLDLHEIPCRSNHAADFNYVRSHHHHCQSPEPGTEASSSTQPTGLSQLCLYSVFWPCSPLITRYLKTHLLRICKPSLANYFCVSRPHRASHTGAVQTSCGFPSSSSPPQLSVSRSVECVLQEYFQSIAVPYLVLDPVSWTVATVPIVYRRRLEVNSNL